MMTAFFDSRGTVYEYAPQGQSPKSTTGISSVAYVMLCGARDHSWVNRQLASPTRQCSSTFLALDSDFLAKNQNPVVCQAPYSPDMAPCDFWLFSKLKK